MKRIIISVCSLLLVVCGYAQGPGKFNQNLSRQEWIGVLTDSMLGIPKDTNRTAINVAAYKNYRWLSSERVNRRLYLWDSVSYKFRHVGFDSIYVRTSTDSVFGRFYGSEVFLYKKDAGAGIYVDSVYIRSDTLFYKKNSVEFYVRKITDATSIGDLLETMVNSSLTVHSNNRLTIADGDKGDIIVSDSGTVWSIGEHAVAYDQMQNVSTVNRVLGRMYSAGSVEELTGSDLVNMIDLFTSTTPGIVPASGGGTSNFLRADGTWAAPPGGSGTDNANAGSGYRLVKPASQDIKTLFNGFAVLLDSSSNTNGITFKADTFLLATRLRVQKSIDSLGALIGSTISYPYTTLKYYTGYGTFGNLTDSVRAALSAGIDILYSGGVISADTTTGSAKLATQGDIDRAIIANIPNLQQVTTAGATTNQPITTSSSITAQVGSDYSQIQYYGMFVSDGTNNSQIYPADITATNGSTAISYRNNQINFAGSGNPSAIKLFPIYHASQTDSVYLPHKGARKDTIAYLSDVRAGGGSTTIASVGSGLDIQTGGAGNIRTLNTDDHSVSTNLISIKKQMSITGDASGLKLVNDAAVSAVTKVYGDSGGVRKYYRTAKVDFTSAVHEYEAYYDSTGEYADGVGVIKFREAEGGGSGVGCPSEFISFVWGVTTYAPDAGDSIFFHTSINGKRLFVHRGGELLDSNAFYGYTVSSGFLYLHPPVEAGEWINIELKDPDCYTALALEAPVEDPPTDMDFDLTGSGTVTESPSGTWTFSSGAYAGNTLTAETDGDGYFQAEIPGSGMVVGLDNDASPDFYESGGVALWSYEFFTSSGTMYVFEAGQSTGAPTSLGAIGSYTHFRIRRIGTTVKVQVSTDGISFSDLHTYSATTSSDLYVKANRAGAGTTILNPKTFGFE